MIPGLTGGDVVVGAAAVTVVGDGAEAVANAEYGTCVRACVFISGEYIYIYIYISSKPKDAACLSLS